MGLCRQSHCTHGALQTVTLYTWGSADSGTVHMGLCRQVQNLGFLECESLQILLFECVGQEFGGDFILSYAITISCLVMDQRSWFRFGRHNVKILQSLQLFTPCSGDRQSVQSRVRSYVHWNCVHWHCDLGVRLWMCKLTVLDWGQVINNVNWQFGICISRSAHLYKLTVWIFWSGHKNANRHGLDFGIRLWMGQWTVWGWVIG